MRAHTHRSPADFDRVCQDALACRLCAPTLPLGPRPVFVARRSATLLIVGHAPGTAVHRSGIPWDDPSGRLLRQWLGIDDDTFYTHPGIAIVPTGLCYPGRQGGGDAPPRPECAPLWMPQFEAVMPQIKLTLAIGRHAQAWLCRSSHNGQPGSPESTKPARQHGEISKPLPRYATLSETVQQRAAWLAHQRPVFPLPHPSPRNRRWLRDRPWFEADVVPELRQRVADTLELAQRSRP